MAGHSTRFSGPGAALALFAAGLAGACTPSPESGHGFTLPEGDVAAGERAFTRLGCQACHTVAGRPELRENVAPEMSIRLGGPTRRVSTYGELVTSIINPSHRISEAAGDAGTTEGGQSRMRNYNQLMTVSELADLVAFLQAQYELRPYEPTPYPPYYPRP